MSRKIIAKNLAFDNERERYYAIFSGTDASGGRARYTRTFQSYEAAMAALRQFYHLEGAYLPSASNCNLGDWLRYYLEEVVARDRAASTIYGYHNIVRCHIAATPLARVLLRDLGPMQLQSYLYDRLDEGLSPNTVRKHYVLLSAALRLAVRQDVLGRNPMDRVDAPRKLPSRYSFYTTAQLQELFNAVAGSNMELPVKLAAYLGLRRSEICGLRWENVDLREGVISICAARTEVGGVVVDKDTKTRSSTRRLGIAGLADIQVILKQEKTRRHCAPSDFVLVDETGQPPRPDYLTARLLKTVRQTGLPKITLHGLRHSFASVANSLGVPMFDISKTLGHASMSVTSTIYTHLFDDTQQSVLTTVGRAIEGA